MSRTFQTNTDPDATRKDRETGTEQIVDDKKTPGNQERPMTEQEEVDEASDESFPASDPSSPTRVDDLTT
ncbi:hypothetical protein [Consotaella salsifontis]|uniref:Uncharacterized protein n=1 Tax=Consotaella salsifontis TaxID=1365950 RepID=A0A1T4Q0I7_9HYPH|nr:hypothetical protein [Consotaella salsifontis]SJZ97047.1 hypothetical protein SAMN05428963_104271 [Consotaella salsifontis]